MFTRSIITRLTLALIIGVAALLLVTSITATAATTASAIARPQADLSVNPGESIQAAIDAANDGDTILVNAGDYTESLTLSKPVSLTGVNSDTTIIHAMPNQRVLTVTGATITNSVVISGLTFTGGQSDIGAGLFITDSAQPIIHSIIATHNRATTRGGGLYTTEALTMTKSQFIDNLAFDFAGHPGYGGGVYAADQAQIAQSQFISNLSPYGAGMYAAHEVSVSATEFISNFAMEGAGLNGAGEVSVFQGLFSGNFGSGGGGSAISAEQVLVVTGTRFVNNSTSEEGGAVFAYHGPVTMTQAQFTNNRTTFKSGGAVYVYSGRLHVSASQFISNSAYANGGAIYANDTADLINVSFISNTALQSGGGLYASEAVTLANVDFISNTALQYGGGAYISDTAILIDTDFISNTARQSGGGAYLAGSATMFDGRFEGNQTLSGDGGGMLSFSSPLELTGTIFIRNSAITGGGGGLVYGGSHARIVNALFSGNTNNMWGAAITTFPNSEMEILNSTITYPGSNPQWAITNIGAELHVTNTIITSHSLAIAGTYQRTTED